jgi:alcohol dehydrogenase
VKAAVYDEFRGTLAVRNCPDPQLARHGVVLQVAATGVCRSDWHGWMGHDADIELPHVPGHELAGWVVAVGADVRLWREGDRVTVPFVCACGTCELCLAGQQQVCDRQSQPGFTHWGSYAELVSIAQADTNLVALPDELDFVTAASLGCRFATSFHALVAQARARPEQWVAIYGCGGVGLSAVMIAAALGAHVIAIDVDVARLAVARSLGAHAVVDAGAAGDVVAAVCDIADGGVHVSIDALGSRQTCINSVRSLRKRGKHIQVGLMVGDFRAPPLPMDIVVARELEIIGSHGMQAHAYGQMMHMIADGRLQPEKLVARTVTLQDAAAGFGSEEYLRGAGITVIDSFH